MESFAKSSYSHTMSVCSLHRVSAETHLTLELLMKPGDGRCLLMDQCVHCMGVQNPNFLARPVKQTALRCRAERNQSWMHIVFPKNLTSQQLRDWEEYQLSWAAAVTLSVVTPFVLQNIMVLCFSPMFFPLREGGCGEKLVLNLNYLYISSKFLGLDVTLIKISKAFSVDANLHGHFHKIK